MTDKSDDNPRSQSDQTTAVHAGRDPQTTYGFVNQPSYRGSTILFPSVEKLKNLNQPYTYGRYGNPTVRGLQDGISQLEGEGADATRLTASGLQAVTTAILGFVETGDEILMVDNVYQPTRNFCDKALSALGVKTIYYDPTIGSSIEKLITNKTKLIFTESPGSQTFEIQDIPAITKVAKKHNIWVLMDNTWATSMFFKPLSFGVDVSIQSATKYLVGHADALLGSITTTPRATPYVQRAATLYGVCCGSEETYLAARGLRTLAVRLSHHQTASIELAKWLAERPEVTRVLHPALESHPQHGLWKRDFTGASGLFAIILKTNSDKAVAAMLDGLKYFGMGYSWGGFESLIIPADPRSYRTATEWNSDGQLLRIHVGLEALEDLQADLDLGFARLVNAA
ncbi:MAG: cystathionine beta-lyase [Hyphomicrobiaceae bacterium]